uniref:Uncharacterized protein n=1 Tax=Rhizophora mucronata TaxID=61149 RepID=A0A2P2NRX9_RHIMU
MITISIYNTTFQSSTLLWLTQSQFVLKKT